MNKLLIFCASALLLAANFSSAAEPLRVFIRGGKKTHGPGAHEHERFLNDWTKLLNERGMKASGAMSFPTDAQLAETDVLLMYAQDGGTVPPERRAALDQFLKRGGGIVAIHTAAVPQDSAHWKSIIGGSWVNGTTKWLEGPMSLYYVDGEHPITREASNFDMDDEIYYDMDISPDVRVLAVAYTPKVTGGPRRAAGSTAAERRASVYDIQPQMWTYERTIDGGQPYRAFVSIPGHLYTNFARPNYRAVLLRGIAWTGHRTDVNEFCNHDELASLRYPEGGPTAPEKAAAKLEVHPDFNISLVASEPLINKAINMDWDAQGRLWVAETPEYPNGRRYPNVELWKDSGSLVKSGAITNRPARDRISILIDTDGDGRADKKEVFYEGLELVTSFVFHKDGVIACAAPNIWLIRDTDGDGKADTVSKLYTGLGIGDTHAVINNLRWGFDGWIYATHGYSATEHVRSGDGARDFGRIGSGVVRFKPDGSAFEQYCSKGGNTWGLDISWDNEVFFTQPTSGDLLNHVVLSESILARGQVPGTRSYKPLIVRRKSFPLLSYDKIPYVQIDEVGRFTASAGCAIYDGGAWPAEWNYSYFTTEPTINLIHHEIVEPEGVSYSAHKVREPEFIAARDMWFRPIETRIGPDGALYIIDFYNQAVVHNDTRGTKHSPANAAIRPDRDHYFARIWRVQHKQAKQIEVPNLPKATPAELVKALNHPNSHVRKNAQRLLTEMDARGFAELNGVPPDNALTSSPRWNIHWAWVLQSRGLAPVFGDAAKNPEVLKNYLRVTAALDAQRIPRGQTAAAQQDSMPSKAELLLPRLSNANARVSLDAILALRPFVSEQRVSAALLNLYPALDDPWRKSAVIGVAAQAPEKFVAAALAFDAPTRLTNFVSVLTTQLAAEANSTQIVAVVSALASGAASGDALKQVCLETLARGLNSRFAPEWSATLEKALRQLVESPTPGVATAALPLIARWDKGGALSANIRGLVTQLSAKLADTKASDEQRAQVAASLLALRNPEALPGIAKLLGPGNSPTLQRRVVEALGESGDSAAGPILANAYAQGDNSTRGILFAQMLKRFDWALAFLDVVQAGKINAADISPADFYRLRTHPNAKVSERATQLWTAARGDAGVEKNALIAKYTPAVTQPGNANKGKELFTANCATCHKLGNLGNEVGPVLTGMGAHGPAELLVSILDPNREVDPSFVSVNIETKDGETYDGIVARENSAMVALRNASGEKEIPVTQIKSRQSSGRSLMPEGFESLGGDALRDLLAFVCASEARYRFIDLSSAFTADSRKGIYTRTENLYDTLKFKKFGPATVAGVPFNIVDPAKTPGGHNLIVLKGGAPSSFSRSLAQKVSTKVGLPVSKLHFLGGVGGWAYPGGGEGTPVMKVTAYFADGAQEQITMKNGDEFADYIREVEVPGSTLAEGVVTENQLRYFSKPLKHPGVVERLEFESFNNGVAPTMVAITAELPESAAGASATASAEATPNRPLTPALSPGGGEGEHSAAFGWGSGTRVLLVGGGSSHDFARFFNRADSALLKAAGYAVNYTEDPEVTARELAHAQVAIFSVNKAGFPTESLRKALTEFVDAGKGLILLHPGVWYNWAEWPDYNRVFAGGGSRGHDSVAEFEVKVTNSDHPLTKGLPSSFKISDELYWFQPDPKGTPIEVLATAHSPRKNADFPMIWVVKHPKTRIACIALGHDARAHDLPQFQQLLKNAVNWCSPQERAAAVR